MHRKLLTVFLISIIASLLLFYLVRVVKPNLSNSQNDNSQKVQKVSPTNDEEKSQTNQDIKLIKQDQIDGFNYWLYENTKYPCGKSGNHEFVILQKGETKDARNLFVRFHGGGFGFYKSDGTNIAPKSSTGQLYAETERKNLFGSVLEDGLSKLIRNSTAWRIMTPSYCSHDLYLGTGQYSELDGFARWGFSAAESAIDFTESEFPSTKVFTGGTSAGASGAFYHGITRDEVIGIIMDSNSMDLTSVITSCEQNISSCCGTTDICQCLDQRKSCISILAERIGFKLGEDEPRLMVASGKVNKPIYYIWNENDLNFGGLNAKSFFMPTHEEITRYNPGGQSIAKQVCVSSSKKATNPCSVHSPTKLDAPETSEIFDWIQTLSK